jgi:hydrogenase-1 operon protein HyaF
LEDDGFQYLTMPKGMSVFRPPRPPEVGDPDALAAVCTCLRAVIAAMATQPFASHQTTAGDYPRFDLSGLSQTARTLLQETLGEGEVSIRIDGQDSIRIQETAFAALWWVQRFDAQQRCVSDCLEACAMPQAVYAAQQSLAGQMIAINPPPLGVMNSPAILAEILAQAERWQVGQPAHVINFTLLPVSPQDMEYLGASLGAGPVTMLSRGYGNCRISSTGLAHGWWVQYFNSMDQMILNTLEVVDIPEAALAAAEDYQDSAERLQEWLLLLEADHV